LVADDPSVEIDVETEPAGVPAEAPVIDTMAYPVFVVTVWNKEKFAPGLAGP